VKKNRLGHKRGRREHEQNEHEEEGQEGPQGEGQGEKSECIKRKLGAQEAFVSGVFGRGGGTLRGNEQGTHGRKLKKGTAAKSKKKCWGEQWYWRLRMSR